MPLNKTIHKKALDLVDRQTVALPGFAGTILDVKFQYNRPTIWYEVDKRALDAGIEYEVDIHVVGTGHEIPPAQEYIGTIMNESGTFVWHLYHSEYREVGR
ncbi:hypothetical protein GMA3_40 [Gordonia phage GMA3]|uniref:DUF7352 domain-containing protein n=1 Tax=Gordonia phage GMA3 TaxID=1647284 RepID=A0A0K0NKZ5_9CAUD|nr:hypothetical protein AU105_gp040 [Gordonia phage GMA3]AKL88217.1 hypothetical protein GMA3_40 [Gordonia phage GMA3]